MNKEEIFNNHNEVSNSLKISKKSIAFFPGRFAPAHKGHINTIEKLIQKFDKVIIGIGSCYESGTTRHPLAAVFREKIILSSLKNLGIDKEKIDFVHLQDFNQFESWIEHVMRISEKKNVTHFVTGNQKDILSVLEEKNIKLPFEFINPENDSDFNYHATDLRNAIVTGDYDTFEKISSFGTIQLMSNIGGFNGIRTAIENDGTKFIPGRQAVDIVFTINHKTTGLNGNKLSKTYFLGGIRNSSKKNFPGWLAIPGGGIEEYESPTYAALRELKDKTGIEIIMLDNSVEPAHILIKTDNKNIIAQMEFLRLFSSDDKKVTGVDGGSSQAFHIHIDEDPAIFNRTLKSQSDLDNVKFYPIWDAKDERLAYQQNEMLSLALSNSDMI